MTMRPEDIKNRTFAEKFRGYDKDEVRSFLFKVADSSRELHEQLTATEAKLASAVTPVADDSAAVEHFDDGVDSVPAALAGMPDDAPAPVETFDAPDVPAVEHEFGTFDAGVSGSDDDLHTLPEAEAFVEAPAASLAEAEQSIADRYGAIGDRIADLLRNADESAAQILASAENDASVTRSAAEADAASIRDDAEERASQMLAEAQSIRSEADAYRDEVMAELASARLEQETALDEARAAAENDVETYRVDSIEEIKALRAEAFVEIDELRSGANHEISELRSSADAEAASMREAVLAEAAASIADDEADAARLREEAETDRSVARAELEDVRAEVSSLLEQARTQSEFIKQEADEIIRTKVRANFEQAQNRIDVLRNTEVASRERIVLAQTELASALNRLDTEPLPELDPNESAPIIDEAERRHEELAAPAVDAVHTADVAETEAVEAEVVDAGVIEAAVIETDAVDVTEVQAYGAETDAIETDAIETDEVHADVIAETDAFGEPDAVEAEGFGADALETVVVDDAVGDDDVHEFGEADVATFEQHAFEADVADASATIEEDSLSGYFGPAPDDQTTGDIISGAFGDDASPETDDSWLVTEVGDVDPVSNEMSAFASSDDIEDFGATEHVVVESADFGDLPVRGEAGDSDLGADLPVRGQAVSDHEQYTAPESFGAASLSEALPADMVTDELGGASQEDALARLVREAMQEAVDSARKHD